MAAAKKVKVRLLGDRTTTGSDGSIQGPGPRYVVIDGRQVGPGETVEVTAADAETLIDGGYAEAA